MEITIKTKDWVVMVYDADSKAEWTYKVLRGEPTYRQVSQKLHSILRYK